MAMPSTDLPDSVAPTASAPPRPPDAGSGLRRGGLSPRTGSSWRSGAAGCASQGARALGRAAGMAPQPAPAPSHARKHHGLRRAVLRRHPGAERRRPAASPRSAARAGAVLFDPRAPDPRRPRDGALPLLPALRSGGDAPLLHPRAVPLRNDGRRHPDEGSPARTPRPLRHRHRRADRRVPRRASRSHRRHRERAAGAAPPGPRRISRVRRPAPRQAPGLALSRDDPRRADSRREPPRSWPGGSAS